LQERVARAIAPYIETGQFSDRRRDMAVAAAIRVCMAEAQQTVEALRYESRYMIGGDAEMGESSDWLRRDAALAALAALAEDTSD
jgi:hypothetical protein